MPETIDSLDNLDLHDADIRQAINNLCRLPKLKRQSAIDYIAFLESQSGLDDEQVSEADSSNPQHLSDLFGILKTDKHVTLDEMDEAVRRRGAGL